MKIHGTAKGGAVGKKDFGVAFGGGGGDTGYPAGQGSDSDGTNTNATANSATAIDGVGSLDFNGSSAYVNLSQNLANSLNVTAVQTDMTSAWTVSMWVYVEDSSSGSAENTYISKITSGYVSPYHELNLKQSTNLFQFGNGVMGYTNWAIGHNGWTHLVLSITGIGETTQTWKGYEDDGSAYTDSTTSAMNWNKGGETPIYCGAQNGTSRFMSGQIQDVCFWNKELSSANRTALFNGYDYSSATDSGNTGLLASEVEKDDIIAYYTFDDGSVTNTAIP